MTQLLNLVRKTCGLRQTSVTFQASVGRPPARTLIPPPPRWCPLGRNSGPGGFCCVCGVLALLLLPPGHGYDQSVLSVAASCPVIVASFMITICRTPSSVNKLGEL